MMLTILTGLPLIVVNGSVIPAGIRQENFACGMQEREAGEELIHTTSI